MKPLVASMGTGITTCERVPTRGDATGGIKKVAVEVTV